MIDHNWEFQKILQTICFIGISVSTLVIFLNPAPGFLPSLYHGVPIYIWPIFIVSFSIGTATTVIGSKNRITGIVLSSLSMGVLYLLPYIRTGRPYGRGDVLADIGRVRRIAENGHFDPEVLDYPFIHIHIFSISEWSGIGVMSVFSIYLPIFIAVFVVFYYLIGRELFQSRQHQLLMVFVALFPMFGSSSHQVTPQTISIYFFIPVLYVLLIRIRNDGRFKVLLAILLLSLVILHPLTGFLFINVLALSVAAIFILTYTRVSNLINKTSVSSVMSGQKMYMSWLLVFTLLYTIWIILSTTVWERFTVRFIQVILLGKEFIIAARPISRTGSLELVEILRVFFAMYGGRLIITAATLFGITGLLLYRWNEKWDIPFVFLIIWFIMNVIYMGLGIASPEVFFPPLRFTRLIYLGTPLFVVITISTIVEQTDVDMHQFLTVLVLFMLVSGIFTASLYDSPSKNWRNKQQTQQEIAGTHWVIDYKSENIPKMGSSRPRYEQSILGFHRVRTELRDDFLRPYDKYGIIPDRLILEDGSYLLDVLEEPRYIAITKADYILGHTKVITPEDEARLAKSTDKVYTNGEYRIYLKT